MPLYKANVRYFQFEYHSPEIGDGAGAAGQGPAKASEPEKLREDNQAALKASPSPEDFMRLMLRLRNADTNNQLAKPFMLAVKEQVSTGITEEINFNSLIDRFINHFGASIPNIDKKVKPVMEQIKGIFEAKDAIFDFIADLFSDVIKDRKNLSEEVLNPGEFETIIEELVTMDPKTYKASDLPKSKQSQAKTRSGKLELVLMPMMKGRARNLLQATIETIEEFGKATGSSRAQKFTSDFRLKYPKVFS